MYDSEKTLRSLDVFIKNTLSVIPIFLLVILLTAAINYFYPKEKIGKILQNASDFKTYFISLIAGIISHGPVFAWYPLLKNLKDKGLKNSALVVFLYGRNIKLTLLPVMIGFFGKLFSMIFILYIAAAALIQGLIFALIDKYKN
jgi:uncharacterized membrane protein YraQ (UPF0718 family)